MGFLGTIGCPSPTSSRMGYYLVEYLSDLLAFKGGFPKCLDTYQLIFGAVQVQYPSSNDLTHAKDSRFYLFILRSVFVQRCFVQLFCSKI